MDARDGGDLGLTLLFLRLKQLNPGRYAQFVEEVRKQVAIEEGANFSAGCLYDILTALPPVESAT